MGNLLAFQVQRGLNRVFAQAGQQATWYRYSGTGGGSPEYGIGPTETYMTAVCSVIQAAFGLSEIQAAGGQYQAGDVPVMVRDALGTDDIVRWDTNDYRVVGTPTPAFLGGTQFYRATLRRA